MDLHASSVDWVHAVDRGGLLCVSESTFVLFEQMKSIVHLMFNIEMMWTYKERTARFHHH